MKNLLTIGFCVASFGIANSQTFSEKISKEFAFEKPGSNNAFMIANINGNIEVEGYGGNKILVEVTKTINAKTEARLEKGKQELSIGIIDRADTIVLYIAGLCQEFGRNYKNWGKRSGGWGYNWDDCKGGDDWKRDEGYDYKFDFKVKVPFSVNVIANTINSGDVSVIKVAGGVKANNVNGAITLKDLTSAAYAYTVNGNVDLDFVKNPATECRFYTLNGDINAYFRKGLAANLGFKSFNGDLFSNVKELSELPVQLEKKDVKNGIKYRVNGNRFKIGQGGPLLDFETFNGNVYVKEKDN